jgi:hypothetical protein
MQDQHLSPLQQLIQEDALGQLRRQQGLMAELGSEQGEIKLDWVGGIARLLAMPEELASVEAEARALWERGIRHIIWAGMGGSVMAVRVLTDLGFCDGQDADHFAIYPLDSTDPATLNALVRRLAQAKNLAVQAEHESVDTTLLRTLLQDTLMVGVAMGMTSEEPITHLTWYTELLQQAQLQPSEHLLVMTLPGSYLDLFAQKYDVPTRSLQLDGGNGTGGRMSAPATRVFLVPAALYLTRISAEPGQMHALLDSAWQAYQRELYPASQSLYQLAATLSTTSENGACRVLFDLPERWHALLPWIEQLMEESLGKKGKGIVVFDNQALNPQALAYRAPNLPGSGIFTLQENSLTSETDSRQRLSELATAFLRWQTVMALYGYLQRITFAGQPAVEDYKARARVLRTRENPFDALEDWPKVTISGQLTLYAPVAVGPQRAQGALLHAQDGSPLSLAEPTPAMVFARTIQQAAREKRLDYLDFTINGEVAPELWSLVENQMRRIGNELLGVPVKVRSAPASYHSTEQSEMDGPPNLVSLRLLTRQHEASLLGTYSDAFLNAQAISTWQAMVEQGRTCFFLVYDGASGDAMQQALQHFFSTLAKDLGDLLV